MHKYFDIELFGWNRLEENWWNITIMRVAADKWSWHLFMIEENRDECYVEWFKFQIRK